MLDNIIIDSMITSLMTNTRETYTIKFDSLFEYRILIGLFEKLKSSEHFISFLRFFLANMYTTENNPNLLTEKMLLFIKYNELSMRQFISDLRIEKGIYDTRKNLKTYFTGLNLQDIKTHELEFYYLEKINELKKSKNILSIFYDKYVQY